MARDEADGQLGILPKLMATADADLLRELLQSLAASRADLVPELIDFLSARLEVSPGERHDAAVAVARALWESIQPDLLAFVRYDDAPDEQVDATWEKLQALAEQMADLPRAARRSFLSELLPYVKAGIAALEDPLGALVYATCRDADDLRHLAQTFESFASGSGEHEAMAIYRELGDRENYLRLRRRHMTSGRDYYDLAKFHVEVGEHQLAVDVARQGVEQAEGMMDELWTFYGRELERSGDRAGYLEIEFRRLISRFHLESYTAFLGKCSAAEWARYEPRFLAALATATPLTRLSFHMARAEYEVALADLMQLRLPYRMDLASGPVVHAARELERRFPHEVLAFYRQNLGRLEMVGSRAEYARRAVLCDKLRHMWVDVLETPEEWLRFARQMKAQNAKRPALQEEFARVIPDWAAL